MLAFIAAMGILHLILSTNSSFVPLGPKQGYHLLLSWIENRPYPQYPLRVKHLGRPLYDHVLVDLLEEAYHVMWVGPNEKADILIITDLNNAQDAQYILTATEPLKVFSTEEMGLAPKPEFLRKTFDLAMTSHDDKSPQHIRFPFYYHMFKEGVYPNRQRVWHNPVHTRPYFACFVVSQDGAQFPVLTGAKKRIAFFDKLSQYKFVAAPGRVRHNVDGIKGRDLRTKTQQGLFTDLVDFYKQCKFAINYENQQAPGWTTEKPFASWLGGAVPIYWGDVSDFNAKAVINRDDYTSDEALIAEIKRIDQDPKAYEAIHKENIFQGIKPYIQLKQELRLKLQGLIKQKLHVMPDVHKNVP